MGFRGLDFGSGLNPYADLMRQSYVDKQKMQRQQEADSINRFKAAQLGYDVGDAPEGFADMVDPGFTEQEIMQAAGAMGQRGPAGVAGPLAGYGPNNPYPADDMEANFLAKQLQQGTVENPTGPFPSAPRGRTGVQGANDAPPPPGTEMREGGLMGASRKLLDAEVAAGNVPGAPGSEEPKEDWLKAKLLEGLKAGDVKIGVNGRIDVKQWLAKEIRDMKMYEFKQSGKGMSLYEELVRNSLKKDITPRTLSTKTPADPNIRINRELSMLRGMLPKEPKAPSAPSGQFISRRQRMKHARELEQHKLDIKAWKNENSDVLKKIDDIEAGISGRSPKAAPKSSGSSFAGAGVYAPSIENKIQSVMKANPGASRKQIIDALKKQGKI